MTTHDFRSLGILYLVSTSDELSNAGSKASLVFFGISASVFLDCSYGLASLLWHHRRRFDDEDLERRPLRRYYINNLQKRLQLLTVCFLFALGSMVMAVDIWTSSRAAVGRAMGAGDLDGDRTREGMQSSMARMGEVAFWLSSWVGTGFMIHRTYLVYVGSPWRWRVLVLPVLVYIASIVTGILSLFDESKRESQRTFTLTCLTLTAAVSSILAASVCLRLYLYRRQALAQMTENLKRRGPVRAAWDRAYDTTAILVESSALNTAFSVIFVGLFASGHESTRIAFPIFGQIQVLSPLLIGYHICRDTAWRGVDRSVGDVREERLPTATGSVILDTYHTGPVSLG
ncbi:hypothetical protein FA13DRAFT_1819997, partial [Coprinellus micaceus]